MNNETAHVNSRIDSPEEEEWTPEEDEAVAWRTICRERQKRLARQKRESRPWWRCPSTKG